MWFRRGNSFNHNLVNGILIVLAIKHIYLQHHNTIIINKLRIVA